LSTAFSQTTRSLARDSAAPALWAWAVAGTLLAAWAGWFLLGRVTVFQLSAQARVEVRQAALPLSAAAGGRVLASRLLIGTEVRAGEVLVELDAEEPRLRLAEESARQTALTAQAATLARELQAREQAAAQDAQAGQAAVMAGQMRAQETAATLSHAIDQARRLAEEHAAGGVSAAEAQQAQAEVKKLAAVREALLADVRRLQSQGAGRGAEQQAGVDALRRQRDTLQGDIAGGQATLQRLQRDVEQRLVRAPAAGRLGDVAPLHAGDMVAAGQTFARIVPAGELMIVADFDPASALGRVRAGQPARLRLAGFSWAQYGSVEATVSRVAAELRDGRLRVELSPRGAPPRGLALQHGQPGAVEVEVESVAPAVLLLRAAGQWLPA
jgi:membrane fusion protein (multidrug efflux system)